MNKVNKNEAPDGYHAVEAIVYNSCKGCIFEFRKFCPKLYVCNSGDRNDGCDVIFKEGK